LAKAYANRQIDRQSYILERRRLIDGVVSGDIELVPYRPPAPDPPASIDIEDGEATLEISLDELHRRRDGRPVGIAAAIGVLAVIIGIGWFYANRPATTAETPRPPPIPEQLGPEADLLTDFLTANTWEESDTDALRRQWNALSPDERDRIGSGGVLRSLGDAIYDRIIEEKALVDLGERAEALDTQRRLLELAAALGIRNERLKRLEQDWQTEQRAWFDAEDAAENDAVTALPAAQLEPVPTPGPADIPTAVPDPQPAETLTRNPAASDPPDAAQDERAAPLPSEPPAAESEDPGVMEPVADIRDDSPSWVNGPQAAAEPMVPAVAAAEPAAPAPGDSGANTPERRRTNCRAGLANQRKPYCQDILDTGAKGPVLVVLPSGRFQMGGEKPVEQPRHAVEIKQPLAFGLYETSTAEFETFCEATQTQCPEQPWNDKRYPAVNVPWSLAVAYTEWLSQVSGATYRLPSEAEWEYAARGGTDTVFPFGDELLPTHARFSFRGVETEPVPSDDRSVNRNAFRLYHVIGNVREWVFDGWADNYDDAPADGRARSTSAATAHVARGGSYADGPDGLRSAARVRLDAGFFDAQTGFRIVRVLDEP
jgi:formylglycine-generating enzyme required for sulfatase activity